MKFGSPSSDVASINNVAGETASTVVNLKKGEKVSLDKVAPSMKNLRVGLGWDANKYSGGYDFDIDASVFLCGAGDKCQSANDIVFYNNKTGVNSCVIHNGDNLTGEGDGDDEVINVYLDKIPSNIEKIAFTVTIYEADKRNQCFGQISNAYIRVIDDDTNEEKLHFDLGEDFSTETAVVIAELYRYNGSWKFNPIGSGFTGGLAELCRNYGLQA